MRRALFVFLAACASSEKPPRTEVAIAPPPPPSASSSPAPAVIEFDASTPDEDLVESMMNADAPPNNESEEDALLVQMMNPTNVRHGTPVVHVDSDTSEAAGQRALIRRVIRQNLAQFRACYEKGRATKPDLAGRVVVRFKIDASGNVTQTESTAGTTLPSPSVVACVVDAFKPLVFPRRQASTVIVNYPIVFAP